MYINNFVRGWVKGGRCFHPAKRRQSWRVGNGKRKFYWALTDCLKWLGLVSVFSKIVSVFTNALHISCHLHCDTLNKNPTTPVNLNLNWETLKYEYVLKLLKEWLSLTICQVPPSGWESLKKGWPKRTHEYTAIITWQRQNPSDISKKDKVITVHDALLCMEPFTHTANMLPIVERCYWLDKFPSFCNNHKKGKPDAGGKLASQDTGGLDQLEYRAHLPIKYWRRSRISTMSNNGPVLRKKAAARQLSLLSKVSNQYMRQGRIWVFQLSKILYYCNCLPSRSS
jgi:hypothetical protein